MKIKDILKENSIKILSVLIATIVILTIAFAILYLFTPVLIGFQTTSDGVIEYFKNVLNPSFVVKTYVNGGLANTIISVYINQPDNVKFYKEYYGETLEIPFSALTNYVKSWEKHNVINTSILIIATYIEGGKAYTEAEEVEYNPDWIINNNPIQIVAIINIIPKIIKTDNITVEQITKQVINTSNVTKYPYTINIIEEEYNEPQIHLSSTVYTPVMNILYFYNFSVPLSWTTLSNNVKNKDNYTAIYFCTKFVGNVSWFGASNYYSYIGISYSTHVHDSPSVSLDKTYLSTLSNPIIYTYYNATIAIVTYTLYQRVHGLNIPICNLSVSEILSLSKFGINVESSSGLTRIVFTNSSGKYVYYLPIGNGSVKLFYTYFGEFVKTLKSLPYGYAYEEEGKVNATKNVCIGVNTIGVTTYYFSNLRTEIYLLNPVVNMIILHGNAQVYFSYFVYSTGWGMPIEGFILNYTSYYYGFKV